MGACMDHVKISSIPEKEKQRQTERQGPQVNSTLNCYGIVSSHSKGIGLRF